MATPTTKTFDAVEMSRRLRLETSRELAGLTREQKLELLNSHLRPFRTSRIIGGEGGAAQGLRVPLFVPLAWGLTQTRGSTCFPNVLLSRSHPFH